MILNDDNGSDEETNRAVYDVNDDADNDNADMDDNEDEEDEETNRAVYDWPAHHLPLLARRAGHCSCLKTIIIIYMFYSFPQHSVCCDDENSEHLSMMDKKQKAEAEAL